MYNLYNSTMHMKTVRNSNLELYRIIVMLAIVAHHYVVNSGLMGGQFLVMSLIAETCSSCYSALNQGTVLFYVANQIIGPSFSIV